MIKTIATALAVSLMATGLQAATLEYACVGGNTPDGTYEVKFDNFTETMSYWGGESFIVNPIVDTRIEDGIMSITFDRRSPDAFGIFFSNLANGNAVMTWYKGSEVAVNDCYFIK